MQIEFKMGEPSNKPFNFPFDPYPEQLQFMRAVWQFLVSNLKLGIFEMPTGGGKSLASLCPSMTWLKRNESHLLLQQQNDRNKTPDPHRCDKKQLPWIRRAFEKHQEQSVSDFLLDRRARLEDAAIRAKHHQSRSTGVSNIKLQHKLDDASANKVRVQQSTTSPVVGVAEVDFSMCDAELETDKRDEKCSTVLGLKKPQVFLCSRTHTQLRQYVQEFRRLTTSARRAPIARDHDVLRSFQRNGMTAAGAIRGQSQIEPTVDQVDGSCMVSLAGRQHLCINRDVMSCGSASDIADACAFQVRRGNCSAYRRAHIMSDIILTEPLDVEEMKSLGDRLDSCPFFGAKKSISDADLVLLPFNMLLDLKIREAAGIDVRDSILIVDEAHNLQKAISSSNQVALDQADFVAVRRLVDSYLHRYQNHLGSKSTHILQQVVRCADAFVDGLQAFCVHGSHSYQSSRKAPDVDNKNISGAAMDVNERFPQGRRRDSPVSNGLQLAPIQRSTVSYKTAAPLETKKSSHYILTATKVLQLFRLHLFDLHELLAFLENPDRRCCQKIRGYAIYMNQKAMNEGDKYKKPRSVATTVGSGSVSRITDTTDQLPMKSPLFSPPCVYKFRSLISLLLNMESDDRIAVFVEGTKKKTEDRGSGSPDLLGVHSCCSIRVEVVCLAVEKRFQRAVKTSRGVLLVGGIMNPLRAFTPFAYNLRREETLVFSCADAAHNRNVIGVILQRYNEETPFDFRFASRHLHSKMFDGLLDLLISSTKRICGGIVVFFPSYEMMERFVGHVTTRAITPLRELQQMIEIFVEMKPLSHASLLVSSDGGHGKPPSGIIGGQGAQLFHYYSNAIKSQRPTLRGRPYKRDRSDASMRSSGNEKRRRSDGIRLCSVRDGIDSLRTERGRALLLCVMGGQFSEGVNFADDLARLLIIVGMPFPNVNDPIFSLHKSHFEKYTKTPSYRRTPAIECEGGRNRMPFPYDISMADPSMKCISGDSQNVVIRDIYDAGEVSVDYATIQCMTTINQTIGRAIRHSRDYAAIIFLDHRYAAKQVQSMLPGWIKGGGRLHTCRTMQDELTSEPSKEYHFDNRSDTPTENGVVPALADFLDYKHEIFAR